MRRERTNLFPCRKTTFYDTLRRTPQNAAFLYKYSLLKVSKLSMGGKAGKYSKPHAPA